MTKRKSKWKSTFPIVLFFLIVLFGTLLQTQTALAAISAITSSSSVQLNWAGTGSSPYSLYREGTLVYNGSATSFLDGGLHYSTGYSYSLNYQNYEKTGGGYTQPSSYWGVVTPAYSYTTQEWGIVTPAHYDVVSSTIPWCKGIVGGNTYEHSPPCEYSANQTTKTEYNVVLVPDQYGWVTVTVDVPAVYGWIDNSYWVPEQYGYVTKTTSITSGLVIGAPPSVAILSPTSGQWGAGLFIPKISVTDTDGDTLTCLYYIDGETTARESRSISNTATAQVVAFSGLNLDSLTEGKHSLKVSVTDNHTAPIIQTVDFNVDKSAPVLGDIQYSTTDTGITVSASATDSGAGLAAAPYRYTIGSNVSGWVANPYTFNNLLPDTPYTVTSEAKDMLDHIASKGLAVYTKAQIPVVSVIHSTESTLDLKISDNNRSNTLYQIKVGNQYIDAAGNLTDSPTSIILSNKQITTNGLQAGTPYNIQAIAINREGILTNWSNTATGTTIANPPVNITTSRTQTSIALSWPAQSGSIRYDIEVDGIIIPNGIAAAYTHTGLSPDTRHTYRVRTINAGGISKWSTMLQINTLPDPPETPINITTSIYGQTYVTLNWDPAIRAESYEVEVDNVITEAGSGTTYTHSGLQPESQHVYRVRANNIGGSSAWSQPLSVTTLPYPPEVPADLKAEPLIHTVTITWGAAVRATAYEIEVDGVILDMGMNTTYVHEGLDPLTGHTYRVRATNIGGKSAWSSPLDVTTHPEKPTVPTNLMATSDETTISLTWYQVLHTDSYEVEVDGQTVVSSTYAQFTHTGLAPDTIHTYRVRAINISGNSEWSASIKMSTLPQAANGASLSLTNIAAVVTNRDITFVWDTVSPEAEYDVEVDGSIQSNGKNTMFHHSGLSANEFHTYKIRLSSGGQVSDWVAVLSLSTLADPPDSLKGLTASAADNSIELRWDRSEGAAGYDVEIDGNIVTTVSDSVYLDKGLTSGTSHTYRVRADNSTGVTAWSPAVTKSTTNPVYTVNAAQNTVFDLLLFASNVQDFWEKTFVVTYDPNALDIVDLYDFTPEKETSSGTITGSPLTVSVTPGRITYKVSRNIVPGTSWSGEITTVKFKSKTGVPTSVNVTVE